MDHSLGYICVLYGAQVSRLRTSARLNAFSPRAWNLIQLCLLQDDVSRVRCCRLNSV